MDSLRIKKRVYRLLGDYLTYNRTEQRGIVVLLALLGLVISFNLMVPSGMYQPQIDPEALCNEARLFELSWKAASDSDSIARAEKYRNLPPAASKWGGGLPNRQFKAPTNAIVVDLNSADTLDLQQLQGIGPAFARRIVNYRNRLRGFHDPSQLLEVFGMDSARYVAMLPHVIANRDSVKPFDINTVSIKEMLRHPYFPFPIAKNIIRYRLENKGFTSIEEFREVPGVTDSIFSRLVFYIRLRP